MLTDFHASQGLSGYTMSEALTRSEYLQPTFGFTLEQSDPYLEWATCFDQGLKQAGSRIRGWSRDTAMVPDEDLLSPTPETILASLKIIAKLREMVMDRVAPHSAHLLIFKGVSLGSDGEISIELGAEPIAVTYRIEADGKIIKLSFLNDDLVGREQLLH